MAVKTKISIHAPHTGRDDKMRIRPYCLCISIHAPHTGRDNQIPHWLPQLPISIHAPHTGRDEIGFSRGSVSY